jgi:hypothetical protein
VFRPTHGGIRGGVRESNAGAYRCPVSRNVDRVSTAARQPIVVLCAKGRESPVGWPGLPDRVDLVGPVKSDSQDRHTTRQNETTKYVSYSLTDLYLAE